jgi:hypothetical protein
MKQYQVRGSFKHEMSLIRSNEVMKTFKQISLFLFGVLVCFSISIAASNSNSKRSSINSLAKTALKEWKFLDGNRINCTINSYGPYADELKTGAAGLEWPKGNGTYPIYTAGIWLGGIHRPTGKIRISNMDYSTEYQPGPITTTFNTTTNNTTEYENNAGLNKYRLYKINKSDTLDPSGNTDYYNWPVDLGAPYIDRNGNGKWDPEIDIPKFYGDQQIWTVLNDCNTSEHSALSTSKPLGVEIQVLYFCFNQSGPLGDAMFMKWKIINKSDADYDSLFIGMWSDPDLGDGNDDLPGVDTTLSLGYVYNGSDKDAKYGTPPPAVGFDFFEGPKVYTGSLTDTALVDGVQIPGYRNLPASSFIVYTNNTFASIVDPDDGSADYPYQAYDYLNGKAGTIHSYLTDANGKIVKFFFSGDPVANTGALPTNFPLGVFSPQDVRMMISTGPFTLAKGDTQEIVGTLFCAQGTSNLNSITKLKANDQIAQKAFNDNFKVPDAPPVPNHSVSELPNHMILQWEQSPSTEMYTIKGYRFEGYRLYQGEGISGPWTLLNTYDLKDGISVIKDYVSNTVDGSIIYQAVYKLPDTGIVYYYDITKDALENTSLVPGKRYYYALTAFAVDTTATQEMVGWGYPAFKESGYSLFTVNKERSFITPLSTPIGTSYSVNVGDSYNHDRRGDDAVTFTVVDPAKVTGENYRVSFNGVDTAVTSWNVAKVIKTDTAVVLDTLLRDQKNFLASTQTPIADGVLVNVHKPLEGPRRDDQSPSGYAYAPSSHSWFTQVTKNALNMDAGSVVAYPRASGGFKGNPSAVTADSLKKVEIRFGGYQKAFRFVKNLKQSIKTIPIADPSFTPYIKRIATGTVFQDTVTVPFTVWDVDPTDSLADRQLTIAFEETNDSIYVTDTTHYGDTLTHPTKIYAGLGAVDGKWLPTYGANGGQEYLYIFSSTYNDTVSYLPNPLTHTGYLDFSISSQFAKEPIMYAVYAKRTDSTSIWTNGDIITIIPNYYLDAKRIYNYTTTAVTVDDKALAKQQLDQLNVYPNPFFAYNPAQTTTLNRFITFSHLPSKAIIRVFTLNGELIRTLTHDESVASSTAKGLHNWDLRNEHGLPVASGMYFAQIEIQGVGKKTLKIAIIQPEERPGRI